ncbi:MAG TPA: hypothetical protein PLC04_01910 [Candidatus Kapabacteria bacterium]|nr:hypothetical protein [Candidatus Kapabacteria bacterium]
MKKVFLILTVVSLFASTIFAMAEDKKGKKEEDQLLYKSTFSVPNFPPANSSFPQPFNETNNSRTSPAISTGYYWIDVDESIPEIFKQGGRTTWNIKQAFVDTLVEPGMWTRILPGPRILPKEHWQEYKADGHPYFRNNANVNDQTVDFFDQSISGDGMLDSTDDAYAGPMPISIAGGFYFNGIRYDSFYVSTNGVIALTNRRYFYDAQGNRTVPTGAMSAYDPMSMDWFITASDPIIGCTRCRNFDDNGGGLGTGDFVRDDFGYTHSVLGLDPSKITEAPPTTGPSKHLDGIRARGISFSSLKPNLKQALIAFAWGDMELSQYSATNKKTDDWGKAYFKRSIANDKLIIYVVNMTAVRNLSLYHYGTYNEALGKRPVVDGDFPYFNSQIVLDGKDSSVTILFPQVVGQFTMGYSPDDAYSVIRRNSICGVSGWARHVNYPTGVPAPDPNDPTNYPPQVGTSQYFYPWAAEYQQYSVYFDHWLREVLTPQSGQIILFKQFKNVLRAATVQYMVRSSTDLKIDLDQYPVLIKDASNYELFAGVPRIGAIQPVALIQNLTNDIQGPNGVNFTEQELNFRVRFRIENQVTQKNVYNRLVPIDQNCLLVGNSNDPAERALCQGEPQVRVYLAQSVTKSGSTYTIVPETNFAGTGYKGIPPYRFVQVYFPPFEPNEFMPQHIGRLRAYTTGEPYKPDNTTLYDAWPFDDEFSVDLFVLRRLPDFNYDGTEFHNVYGTNMPSVWKWVNINAEMVDGEVNSENPLPPRGPFNSAYEAEYNELGYLKNITYTNIYVNSPVIKMNRVTLTADEPNPATITGREGNGDELRSFPINMIGLYNSILSVSVQRTLKQSDWPRGWCDRQQIGPEPRVFSQSNYLNQYTYNADPDVLSVEFALPSDDGLNGITNIPQANWSVHPRRGGAAPVKDIAAINIFGGGGYRIGFLESDKDSALAKEDRNTNKINGLRASEFDDGIDHEFKKYFVTIPDTFIRWKSEGAKNFRFRLHVYAQNDQKMCPFPGIADDYDDFLIDNVYITIPKEVPDIEVNSINIIWPYTMAPASQATNIPIKVTVSNNSKINAANVAVKVKIFRSDAKGHHEQNPIYCRIENIGNFVGGMSLEVPMPSWNARKSQTADLSYYYIQAIVMMQEKDMNSINDTNFTIYPLQFGESYAYDPPVTDATSDVGPMIRNGRGLTLPGYNFTGSGSFDAPQNFDANREQYEAGSTAGMAGSGSFAIRFNVLNKDSLRGFETYFTQLSLSPDPIQVLVFTDVGGKPQSIVTGTHWQTQRMYGNLLGAEQYVRLQFPQPVELPPGSYWAVIAQLGETGLELGAKASRMGMRVVNLSITPDGILGTAANYLNLDKNFRVKNNQGNRVNANYFMFENLYLSGTWYQMTPPLGNPGYPHLDHVGRVYDLCRTKTFSNGSWIPMHRPYFGPREYGQNKDEYQWCSDDIPIELSYFNAEIRKGAVDLIWETSSETNNLGFYIEKRDITADQNQNWSEINFVSGKGTTTIKQRYNYVDKDLLLNHTYEYRLRQVDKAGLQSCSATDPVRVTYIGNDKIILMPNSPNPFNGFTKISFTLATKQHVNLDVIDIYGNVVKTIADADLDPSTYEYYWEGKDQNDQLVPSGTYIYRLTSGSDILTGKMTLVR